METTVVVPPRHHAIIRGTGLFKVSLVADGVAMLVASPRRMFKVRGQPFEQELVLEHEKSDRVVWQLVPKPLMEVDPNPVEVPLKHRHNGLRDVVVEQIQRYLSATRDPGDYETLEESMDFEAPEGDIGELVTEAEKRFRQGLEPVKPLNPVPLPGKRVRKGEKPSEEEGATPPKDMEEETPAQPSDGAAGPV